ncbi:glycoside hydrolase family 5 protein [Algoriphagus taiwanensis]|uniref:Glycoside hydrolase family 5 protein n=1 Tax=Algoriphagus taiwanensis TaxID=1445656 RepID=A0ABQ6Q571_9BACT|nr:glycoside hydrolase family 5 protein [Algoriphagus taiwanensis]
MPSGINLTGYERVWEEPVFSSRITIKKIKEVKRAGFDAVRIPLALSYLLKQPNFERELRKLAEASIQLDVQVVIANFNHGLSEEDLTQTMETLSQNWERVLQIFPANQGNFYFELANEPELSPDTWYKEVNRLVPRLQQIRKDIPFILGATNFNSLFELSRMQPWSLEGVIYTFHYYEPYLFTHQGTAWTGPQNSTLDIPFPFNPSLMPKIDSRAKGTPGEVNYRDYEKTGNSIAIEDKIGQISSWARRNGVQLWCTEFGVTQNADEISRKNYLEEVQKVLIQHQIPGFVWEWEGNFGIKNLKTEK